MSILLVKFHTVFLPELSEGRLGVGWTAGNLFSITRWMTGGHHVLERVASLRREMLGSVLSVQALAGLSWPTQCGRVLLPKNSGQDFQESLDA